jgi:hypothetical protein
MAEHKAIRRICKPDDLFIAVFVSKEMICPYCGAFLRERLGIEIAHSTYRPEKEKTAAWTSQARRFLSVDQ